MVRDSSENFEGLIIASNWDINGNITQVSFLTKFEDEFIVEMDTLGNELISHCQNELRVRGYLDAKGILNIVKFAKVIFLD